MPDQIVDQRWKRRTEYHLEALANGWEVDAAGPEATAFVRDGWRIEARWSDNSLPAAMAVYSPDGLVVESRSFLMDKWGVGEELEAQLKSPGPVRAQQHSLETLIEGVIRVMELMGPDGKAPAAFVAEKLRDCLEEAS